MTQKRRVEAVLEEFYTVNLNANFDEVIAALLRLRDTAVSKGCTGFYLRFDPNYASIVEFWGERDETASEVLVRLVEEKAELQEWHAKKDERREYYEKLKLEFEGEPDYRAFLYDAE